MRRPEPREGNGAFRLHFEWNRRRTSALRCNWSFTSLDSERSHDVWERQLDSVQCFRLVYSCFSLFDRMQAQSVQNIKEQNTLEETFKILSGRHIPEQ